jgi:hypothetical protein
MPIFSQIEQRGFSPYFQCDVISLGPWYRFASGEDVFKSYGSHTSKAKINESRDYSNVHVLEGVD